MISHWYFIHIPVPELCISESPRRPQSRQTDLAEDYGLPRGCIMIEGLDAEIYTAFISLRARHNPLLLTTPSLTRPCSVRLAERVSRF